MSQMSGSFEEISLDKDQVLIVRSFESCLYKLSSREVFEKTGLAIGRLYVALKELEDARLLESEWGKPNENGLRSRFYGLTDAGWDFHRWLESSK